ncbi:MAG: S41 family peptidase [Rikenellaceae bacterium]
MKHKIKHKIYIAVAAVAATVSIYAVRNDDFALTRNIEIMINLMREISENYVDQVDTDLLLEYAAEGISRRLDPYTEYLPEKEMSSFEVLTTGKYGGIGSLIRKDSDYVKIAQPYEGSPADRAGLIIGDRIVAIDGEDAAGWDTEQVSAHLKGTPSSAVEVTVRRLVSGEDETLRIVREKIAIPGIPYYGFVGDPADGVGYVQHSDFTVGVAQDMRAAIEEMQAQGLKALILDYRNNGGGIMQEAVDVVSLFTPRGTEVVTLKGRRDSAVYSTTKRPAFEHLPLAVLINENSASASEIVAGSLQDLDRAVLVGAKSFGKGLVQSPRPVGYNSYVKMTTSKYYIPSGRCIQELDYSDHSSSGKAVKVADSLRHAFYTKGGREVFDGGGISPDESIEAEYISRFAATLYALGHIDNYGDDYFRRNFESTIDVENFTITEQDYEDFCTMIGMQDIKYESASRGVLKALKEAASSDLYADLSAKIEEIEAEIKDDTASNLESYRDEIIESINANIILRYAYQAGVIRNSLVRDKEVARAVEILLDEQRYNSILNPEK